MPRYVQFPRSNVAGTIPERIDPGSFALNWKDRRVYTGGPDGAPLLMAYRLSDHDDTRSYRRQDIAYRNGSLWRCIVDFTTGAFNAAQWEELTDNTTAPLRELNGTVWISGGVLTNVSGDLSVSAGSGVVMDLSNPGDPMISSVSWSQLDISPPFAADANLFVGINAGGSLSFLQDTDIDPAWRRGHVVLGWITTDDAGEIATVDNIGVKQHQVKETLIDLLDAIGPFKVSGCEITMSAPSEVRVASGELFWKGLAPHTLTPNTVPVSTIQALPVYKVKQTGYSDTSPVSDPVLDVANWDSGGTLTAVTGSLFTTQFIFLSPSLTEGKAVYGQKTYASLDAALEDVGPAYDTLVRPDVVSNDILLGAVCSNSSGSSQSTVTCCPAFINRFGGSGGGGGGDTSQFLLISGVRAMTGDLDLGGSALINGVVDGDNISIRPETSGGTGVVPVSPDPNELFINSGDAKVFSGSNVVADRIMEYSAGRAYAVGDQVFESNNLYTCTTPIATPEAFNGANWQLIGADNTGSLAQAVILDPLTATRNEIDLTGKGGTAAALKVTFDNTQSVDIVQFSPDTRISRFGEPVGTFGESVFRVSQVSHLLTAVGTPVTFNGTSWVKADNTDPGTYPEALVHKIIDADNFLLQVSGRINNLSPQAFVGNVAPTPGEFYYASAEAGKMTIVEGQISLPALYCISPTQGIVKLTGTGTTIPDVPTTSEIIDLIYPVGSTYITIDPTNPGTRLPGTTWQATAQGRAIIGVGSNGESSWAVGEERGSETHTLSEAEMPSHAHGPGTLETDAVADHTHTYSDVAATDDGNTSGFISNFEGSVRTETIGKTTGAAGGHTHALSGNTASAGGDQPHNNVQPSVAFHIWLRIT